LCSLIASRQNKLLFVLSIASCNVSPPLQPQSLHNEILHSFNHQQQIIFSLPCRLPQSQVGYPVLFSIFNHRYQSTLTRLHFLKRKRRNKLGLMFHNIVSVLSFLSASSIQMYFFLLGGRQQMSVSITFKKPLVTN